MSLILGISGTTLNGFFVKIENRLRMSERKAINLFVKLVKSRFFSEPNKINYVVKGMRVGEIKRNDLVYRIKFYYLLFHALQMVNSKLTYTLKMNSV